MRRDSSLRDGARRLLPQPYRRFLRRVASEAPQRLRDLPADLASIAWPGAFGGPLPPPRLRARVGQSSRRVFAEVGREGARQLLDAFARARAVGRAYPAWLDFGCGCGRVARFVASSPDVRELHGVDVDAELIGWAAASLPGRFSTMGPEPPLPFPPASFDVVYAISIFTHYTEPEQWRWLDELARILRPGGLLLATTLSPAQAGRFPGVSVSDCEELSRSGFLCVNAESRRFNERAAFHAPAYLEAQWGRRLIPRAHATGGFVSYQDLSVWERPPAPVSPPPESAASGP